MYISRREFRSEFEKIKASSLSHSTCKLVIFVSSLDIDALCAANMLTELLRKELIQYQVTPIVGYSDLISHYSQVSEEISNIILVGCCAMIPVEDVLQIDAEKFYIKDNVTNSVSDTTRKIYVIDGHKPWHLDNLFGSHMVVCFDDGHINEKLGDELKSYNFMEEHIRDQRLKRIARGQDPDEESDSDESEDEDEPTDNDDEEDSDDERIYKRRKIVNEKRERMNQRLEHYQRLETYYKQGTSITYSVSLQVYILLSEIGETNIRNLWTTIVGTISLDAQNPDIYKHSVRALTSEVGRLATDVQELNKSADSFTITREADYQLFLLRQNNLFESMLYSTYVNTILSCWKETGRTMLYELLARASVPLVVAREKWGLMDPVKRDKLVKLFNEGSLLRDFKLDGMKRQGFVRNFGFYPAISASEYVDGLLGLLQVDEESKEDLLLSRRKPGSDDAANNGEADDEAEEDIRQIKRSIIARKEKIWRNNFWNCWNALEASEKGQQLLNKGILHAKDSQRVVFESGKMIFERRTLKRMKYYRYILLDDLPELHRFRNPLLLKRLGDWVLDWQASRESSFKPLLLAALDTRTDSYLVMGLGTRFSPNSDVSERLKGQSTDSMNKFNLAFGRIAEEINRKNSVEQDEDSADESSNENKFTIRVDSFDAAIVEIERKDISQFLTGINRIFKNMQREEEQDED
ncbi:hypothetical protein WICPIJ_008744 [Wickerhamomyces pijperi]|uniref:CDC45-like protein n=1 Tax=Wickerhamomyces pijperi TaxID=599730 RepID=A0A9P8PV64_WICPI|nr:hypothetical protein WICPIJ_008744 [Wickerhamomyces pijperi]